MYALVSACQGANQSLARFEHVFRHLEAAAGAKRIDVQTAPACVSRPHREPLRPASGLDVAKHALHALLMKLVMATEGDDVAQQRRTIELRPRITHSEHAPVRLAGNQAIGFEQVRI